MVASYYSSYNNVFVIGDHFEFCTVNLFPFIFFFFKSACKYIPIFKLSAKSNLVFPLSAPQLESPNYMPWTFRSIFNCMCAFSFSPPRFYILPLLTPSRIKHFEWNEYLITRKKKVRHAWWRWQGSAKLSSPTTYQAFIYVNN